MARYSQVRRRSSRAAYSGRGAARRSYGRRAPARGTRRASARRSGASRRSAPQTIRLVVQTAPQPSLSAPAPDMEKKARVSRF